MKKSRKTGLDLERGELYKQARSKVRDAEQEPPRGEGVVPLPKREGEAAKRLRGSYFAYSLSN